MISDERYTPSAFIEAAREVMGSIDLDPATSWKANEVVKATFIRTEAHNGLEVPWVDLLGQPYRVWLNPPSPPKPWWVKLMHEWQQGHILQAVYLAYNQQQLQSLQVDTPFSPGAFPICVPNRRINFLDAVTLEPQKSPKYPNAIIYVPGLENNTKDFLRVFKSFGDCYLPA